MWTDHSRVRTLAPVALQMVVLMVSMLLMSTVSLSPDAKAMQEVRQNLKLPTSVDWSGDDPCQWQHVGCDNNVVTRIQIGNQNVFGSLSPAIADLKKVQVLELMGNNITGALPDLKGLIELQMLNIHDNMFDSISPNIFDDLSSLTSVYLDNNPFKAWSIPVGLKSASSLMNFSANSANIIGSIPEFFSLSTFPSLSHLHMSGNSLQGNLPSSFRSLTLLKTLWLGGQKVAGSRTLTGTIEVLQNMTSLVQVWLNMNGFTGPIPDLSGLSSLEELNLRDNSLTGPVPPSLMNLAKLKVVKLTNNALQGRIPTFNPSVAVDMSPDQNNFCFSNSTEDCDSRVNALIAVMETFGYPYNISTSWKGNDPCTFTGITCSADNITVINLQSRGLTGTISPKFADLTSVTTIYLSRNNISGTVPDELTRLPHLQTLDLSFNHLNVSSIPEFAHGIQVRTDDNVPYASKESPSSTPPGSSKTSGGGSKTGKVVGAVIGSIVIIIFIGLLIFYLMKKKRFYGKVKTDVHPNHSGSDVALKYMTDFGGSDGRSKTSSGPSDVHGIEANNLIFSIDVLREVTNNFSEDKILGKGGFGTVYKGELHDGTKIAVKRMNSGALGDKGLEEFKSEIAVLTKVRHRHLVGLLGFCLERNEKLLVYEYLPQGTLSSHLFSWQEEGWKPLRWDQRLIISLDVGRGVEYLHGLAHQCFIHRDLKPSNILLGDDMRAKVSDFGLVRLAPDGAKASIATKLAGTFGYLAPEYAVTGRITTKVDVFAYGVILMEIITGRRAIDESQPEDGALHLATWFRRMFINKDTFQKAIDTTIDLDEETLASVLVVAELAGHCCAREPSQRPEMSHVVTVISSLTHKWKPTEDDSEDVFGNDFDMNLPQALRRWQALEDTNMDISSSSYYASRDNTQTSLATKHSGFADPLRDGR